MNRGAQTAAAVCVGATALIAAACSDSGGISGAQAALVSSWGDRRAVEPRLSGGFPYAPCRRPEAVESPALGAPEPPPDLIPDGVCSPPPSDSEPHAYDEAYRRIWTQDGGTPSVETLHAQGLWQLLWGEKLTAAVTKLEQSAARAPGDARLWSDLAAARLVRAQREDRPEDLGRAAEAAHRALEADPALPEARFNLALALEALFLRDAARRAWEGYLDLDRSSGWAEEARGRLAELEEPDPAELWEEERHTLETAAQSGEIDRVRELVARHPQAVREWAETELLGRWAEEQSAGRLHEAEQALGVAGALGTALRDLGGDTLVAESVAAIEQARSDPLGAGRLRSLVEGHRAYARGLRADAEYAVEEAAAAFTEARDRLAAAGSPFAAWADFQLAVADYRQSRLPQGVRALAALESTLEPERYPALRGRIGWIRGMCLLGAGRPTASQEAYRQALAAFEAAGEAGNAGSVHMLLAENLTYLDRPEEAWRERYRALAATGSMTSRRRRHAVLDDAADTLEDAGLARAALDFQDEMVRLQHQALNATDPAHAHLKRSRTLAALGWTEDALADLDEAESLAQSIPVGVGRDQIDAEIARSRAQLLAHDDPVAEARELTTALDFFDRGSRTFALPELYRARADAFRRAGEGARAEADLRAGLAIAETQLREIADPGQALSYMEGASALVDGLLAQLAGDPERLREAFVVADRSRGRVLSRLALRAAQSEGRSRKPLPSAAAAVPFDATVDESFDELLPHLPRSTALVQYAALEERLLIWVVRTGGVEALALPVRREALAAWVGALRSGLAQASSEPLVEEASHDLYRHLVAPVEPWLTGADTVIFIPDRTLEGLPFAALRDPETGRFLVEERAVGVAPSAAFHLLAADRERRLRGRAPASALVLGVNDSGEGTGLRPLTHAEAEARAVGRLYGVTPRLGPRATRQTFLAEAGSAEIVTVAGHAVANPARPELSYLALAADGGGDGALYAREILDHRFPATRLVVLSACSTAGGVTTDLAAGLPLAQTFLAAGVPVVTASLWPVNDEATDHLMRAFHVFLAMGYDPVDALRRAQLELLHGSEEALRNPAAWAGFEVFGGATEHHPGS